MSLRKTIAGAVIALGMTMGSSAFAATVVNLGFAIDHSGSLSVAQYDLQKNGLAKALELIPTSGDYEYKISVVSFGGDVAVVVPPTIVTAANLSGIQSKITSRQRNDGNTGSTRTGDAINTMVGLYSDIATTLTMFNISTDGVPNSGADWFIAANNARGAGVNSISFEAVGNSINTNTMLTMAGPGAIEVTDSALLPDTTTTGFVFRVNDFEDYENAISAKIQKIIDDVDPNPVPVPAALPLLLGALGMMGALRLRRRAA